MKYDAWAVDPEMPQLATILDPEAMMQYLKVLFDDPQDEPWDVVDCRLERFRYRPATRSIALYAVHLRNPTSGRERCNWISGVTYPGDRAERRYHKRIRRQAPCRPPGGRDQRQAAAVAFVPEARLILQRFPYDDHLPQLASLVAELPAAMAGRVLEMLGPGHWYVEGYRAEPVRYRTFLCATLKCHVQAQERSGGQRAWRNVYLKLFHDDEGLSHFHQLNALESETLRQGRRLRLGGGMAYFPAWRTLMLAEAAGRSLLERCEAGDLTPVVVDRVAEAMAELHLGSWPVKHQRTRDQVLERARHAADFVRWAHPQTASALIALMADLERAAFGNLQRPVHQDLKLEHIFVDGEQVQLIDLDSMALGHPMADLAALLVRLKALAVEQPALAACAGALSQRLQSAYLARVPPSWQAELPAYLACAALKLALYFVQHQHRDWRALCSRFVTYARQALDGDWRLH